MTPYQPPFSLNNDMLTSVAEIAELLGRWKQSSSEGLVPQLRRGKGVGIFQNQQLVHMAPPPKQVPRLMNNLLNWLANTKAHPLIASCAFHYELEFIHPFSDGNGRMGRLWQTLILSRWQPMLAYLPVETVIKSQQQQYYQTLGEADQAADCSSFIVFMLNAIQSALQQALLGEHAQENAQENTQEKILALLSKHPELTRDQLAKQLHLTPDGVKYHLQKLKTCGRIVRVGATKSGYWKVVQPKTGSQTIKLGSLSRSNEAEQA